MFEQDLQVYIQDLLGGVNRGGSIKVNGNMYNFILKLEEVVRWILRWMLNVLSWLESERSATSGND